MKDRGSAPRLGAAAVTVLVAGCVVVPLALLVRAGWAPLDRFDRQSVAAAHRGVLGSGVLLTAARTLTVLGNPALLWLLTLLLALALALALRRSAPGARRLAAYVLLARLGAQLLSSGTKVLVARARPVLVDPVAHASGPSFPSGHALGAAAWWAALAAVALHLRPGGRPAGTALQVTLALLVPLAVGASRVLLGVHYVTDVAAGLVLGWATSVALALVLLPARPQRPQRPQRSRRAQRPYDVRT